MPSVCGVTLRVDGGDQDARSGGAAQLASVATGDADDARADLSGERIARTRFGLMFRSSRRRRPRTRTGSHGAESRDARSQSA